MSSEFLQDLVCTCKVKSAFSKGCICFEQNLSCTGLCPCQENDICQNVNTRLVAVRNIDDDEDFIFLYVPYKSLLAIE